MPIAIPVELVAALTGRYRLARSIGTLSCGSPWSDDRKPGKHGRIPPVGNTVDTTKATYANTIGSAELMGPWTDPEFDPNKPALYYVRVLEIPTPRWTTYDAAGNNLALLPDVSSTIQQRAWTSPIWYSPK